MRHSPCDISWILVMPNLKGHSGVKKQLEFLSGMGHSRKMVSLTSLNLISKPKVVQKNSFRDSLHNCPKVIDAIKVTFERGTYKSVSSLPTTL